MSQTKNALAATIAGAIAVAAVSSVAQTSGPAPMPSFKFEKCYGIAKRAKNDCQTASSSCAGTAKRDRQPDAWLYVPAGTCDRIAGAKMSPKG